MSKTLYLLLMMVVITLLVMGSCRKAPTASPEAVVRVGYMQVSTGLPIFVGLDKGIFAKNGIKIEASPFDSVNQAMDAMIAGRLDAVQGVGFPTFLAVFQNAPDKFLVNWTCVETDKVFANGLVQRKGLGLTSIADLRGKRVGTYTGTTQLINLRIVLEKAGLDPDKDVAITQVSRQMEIQALAAGQFDVLFSIEPSLAISLARDIAEPFVPNARVEYIMNPFPAGGGAVSTAFARDRPDVLKRLQQSLSQAIDFIAANSDAAKATLPNFTPIDADIAAKGGIYLFIKPGQEDVASMQRLADLYLEKGELKQRVDVTKMILPPSR